YIYSYLLLSCYLTFRHLHSFPTRRSSDLNCSLEATSFSGSPSGKFILLVINSNRPLGRTLYSSSTVSNSVLPYSVISPENIGLASCQLSLSCISSGWSILHMKENILLLVIPFNPSCASFSISSRKPSRNVPLVDIYTSRG